MYRFVNKFVLVFSLMVMSIFANAQYYDATESFSLTNNPDAGWSRGWTQDIGSTFILSTTLSSDDNGSSWIDATQGTAPWSGKLIRNISGASAGQIAMHNGSRGQHPVLRFIVPEAGGYTLSSQYYEGDGGHTNITVLLNQNTVDPLFSASTDTNPVYDTILYLNSGDTVDFVLSGDYIGATTPFRVRFTRIPDSGTPVSIAGGIILQGTQNTAQQAQFTFSPQMGAPFTRNVNLAVTQGLATYQVSNIPSDLYTVSIKGSKWLRKNIIVDARFGNVTNANATLLAGDGNNDNFVDITDLLLLIAAYNKVSPNAGYSEAADFTCDGVNDIADLLLLIANYNRQGDS